MLELRPLQTLPSAGVIFMPALTFTRAGECMFNPLNIPTEAWSEAWDLVNEPLDLSPLWLNPTVRNQAVGVVAGVGLGLALTSLTVTKGLAPSCQSQWVNHPLNYHSSEWKAECAKSFR